jgi:ubiquinone/menaquinone biosynthesis C-methylase UbiE
LKHSSDPNEKSARANFGKRFLPFLLAHCNSGYERLMAQRKRALLGNLSGNVLELGPGTGPNLGYYGEGVRWIGIEPNPYMHPYLRRQAARQGLSVELHGGKGERIEAEDESVDAVVTTLVFCSVQDAAQTLREILRVLKPGGRFVFIEHVAARRGTALRRAQQLLRPVWNWIADGCCPDRETWVAVERAGFARVDYEHFRVAVPIVGPHIAGVAVKQDGSLPTGQSRVFAEGREGLPRQI